MPLPTPNLDDRRFQDILDEARRRIPLYCPEWTDHNLTDPGITLLELFAWMTDLLLYRLNRVPDKNYVKFLELLGVRLQTARPAVAELIFRLTAPQPVDVAIPQRTEVGTIRTETQESTTFTTDEELAIRVPQLTQLLAARGGSRFHDYREALEDAAQGLGVFSEIPQEDDALYFGFGNDLKGHALAFSLQCRMEGVGVDPKNPPIAWETWDGVEGRWARLKVDEDSTGGLNRDGVVILDTPLYAAPTVVDGRAAFWVRCRLLRPRPGQPGYSSSPRLNGVLVESLGARTMASHKFKVYDEVLGTSDGTPGQSFRLATLPVLPRSEGETLEVQCEDGTFEPWTEVSHFGASGPDDPHFMVDDVTGTVELGPRIRTPRGLEQQFGRVPPSGRVLRFTSYMSGGGVEGNVGARALSVLKSSVPYVAWVANFQPAFGGTDTEDLEHAKWRGPLVLRTSERAVTVEDFERLAREASSAVARSHCLPVAAPTDRAARPPSGAGPGLVRVLLVPTIPDSDGPVPRDRLALPARVIQEVQAHLDRRRLLTCELLIGPPTYVWVHAAVKVLAQPQADRGRVAKAVSSALYRYLHPMVGGPEGTGWPFGRELMAGDIYARLQQVEDVAMVEEVVLHMVDPDSERIGAPLSRLPLEPDALICSWEHSVEVESVETRWK
ncbi:MAG: putative baseplate assembly protein [Chloroflexi bacterium]|nr:putative baseplate assembly protein [Chloroflexota bacterium]